jgi:GNAT superfamily N-acetyltransferase
MALAFRLAEPADMRLVLSSWLSAYRTAHAAGLIQMRDWSAVMRPQLEAVLSRPGCLVTVASDPDETDRSADLYGWIAAEAGPDPFVHFVYVKQSYRNQGLARALFTAAGIDPAERFEHSCRTAIVARLRSKIPRARFNPIRARQ